MRLPLIDGQGNFGSVDGDPAAAMRYTESRLARPALALAQDIDLDTVDFQANYDGKEHEPVVMPARFPDPREPSGNPDVVLTGHDPTDRQAEFRPRGHQ